MDSNILIVLDDPLKHLVQVTRFKHIFHIRILWAAKVEIDILTSLARGSTIDEHERRIIFALANVCPK